MAQMMTPALLGLVLAYFLRHLFWIRRLLLIGILVYVVYLGEQVLGAEFLGGVVGSVKQMFEPNIEGIPTIEKHVADRYIIARIGRENFNQLVVFDPQLSKAVNGAREQGFQLVYHFEPLLEYQESDTFEIVVRNEMVESGYYLPNCVKDESLCQFEVSREEVVTIARENGLWSADLELGTTNLVENGLAIEVKSCGMGRRMLIDYRDGRVIGTSEVKCE